MTKDSAPDDSKHSLTSIEVVMFTVIKWFRFLKKSNIVEIRQYSCALLLPST